MHIIGGTILPVWETVENAVKSCSRRDTMLRIVRATTDDEEQCVGLRIPTYAVPKVLEALKRLQSTHDDTPHTYNE